jgi:protein-disulfide isomerase
VTPASSRRRDRQSKRPFFIALAVIVAVGLGALGYSATRSKSAVTVDPNLPPPVVSGHLLGSASAPVEVTEYADFECPACGNFAAVTEPDVRSRLIETGKMRLRFFLYPLPMHKNTWIASNAAECANDQGKFWEMHDRLFVNQDQWNGEATSRPKGVLEGYAREIGLDVPKWSACVDDQRHQREIEASRDEAIKRSVNQTPSFIIGGKLYAGPLPYDEMKKLVEQAAASAPAASASPIADTAGARAAATGKTGTR